MYFLYKMKFNRLILLSFLIVASSNIFANDSLISKILLRLEVLQNRYDPYFIQGLFPCYRQYVKNEFTLKKDDNIFFTGIVAYTLYKNKTYLSPENRLICNTILERFRLIAPKFKNTKGRNVYNFWRTDSVKIFPNSGWINWFNKTNSLADDLDDTAILLMALDEPDSSIETIHTLMQDYVNKPDWPVKNTMKEYQQYGAYSCWFGKKMMVEFDVCTIANVLLMVQSKNLAWKTADSASIDLLAHMIERKHHVTAAGIMSVYYKKTAIILYHLARLMSIKPILQLDKYKSQLIEEAKAEYVKTDIFLDKILLRTALLQWGVNLPDESIVLNDDILQTLENTEYPFFIANLACTMPKNLAYLFVNSGISKFNFYCPAFNEVILLEYIIEQQGFDKKNLNNKIATNYAPLYR